MYLNQVKLIGFIGSAPELRQLQSGRQVTTFSVAFKPTAKKGTDEKAETQWFHIEAWGKRAEYAAGFKKGAHVLVEGFLAHEEYEKKDHTMVIGMKIVATDIVNLRPNQRVSAADPDCAPVDE